MFRRMTPMSDSRSVRTSGPICGDHRASTSGNGLRGRLVELDRARRRARHQPGRLFRGIGQALPTGVHIVRLQEDERWSVTVTAASRHRRTTRDADGTAGTSWVSNTTTNRPIRSGRFACCTNGWPPISPAEPLAALVASREPVCRSTRLHGDRFCATLASMRMDCQSCARRPWPS